jgi:phosphatidylglycerol---prolipoprotein diacylglyceryl transferase
MTFLYTFFGQPAQPMTIHFIFEVLAYFIGYRYYVFLRRQQGDLIGSHHRIWIVIGAAGGALIGSRVLGALENPELLWEYRDSPLYYYSNKTIIGGLLGGLWGVETIKKWIGEKHSSGDLFTYPLIVGIAIGRVGCFLAGLPDNTYGSPTASIFGYDFGDGIRRHPVQLYEIFFLIMLKIKLLYISKKLDFKSGSIFKLFMISYLVCRFLIEFIKPAYLLPIQFSVIQVACLVGLLYYGKTILHPKSLLTTHLPENQEKNSMQ